MRLSEPSRGSSLLGGRIGTLFAWAGWSVLLGTVMSVAVTVLLFGRVPLLPLAASFPRSPSMLLTFALTAGWWLLYGHLVMNACGRARLALAVLPSLPLLALLVAGLMSVYLSDTVNHQFYYSMVYLNQPKSLTILLLLVCATIAMQSIALEFEKGRGLSPAIRVTVERLRDPFIAVFFIAIGVLQAIVYLEQPAMDFPRYWIIADAMVQGAPYPVADGGEAFAAGGRSLYLIDLPVYPMLLVASFAALGHTTLAAYLPLVIPNAALPLLTYLVARELVRNRAVAACLAGLIVLFPPLRFYTLNWFVQDSLFLAMLMLCILLAIRIARGERRPAVWLAFGLLDAAVVLTRPEGIAYGFFLALIMMSAPQKLLPKAATAAAILVPMALFSLTTLTTFGTPWAESYGGTLKVQNLATNLPVLVDNMYFTDAIKLDGSQLTVIWSVLVLLAVLGSTPFFYRPRRLVLFMAPAWINLAAIYMADPRVSGARLWFDFFRHMSYALPFLVLAAGAVLTTVCRSIPGNAARGVATGALVILLTAGVFWNLHYLAEPIPAFGPTAGNLLSQPRVNFVDVMANPMDIPVVSFERVERHSRPLFPAEFMASYPDPIMKFYDRFDAGKQMSGGAYQTGTMLAFLAALLLAIVPARWPRAVTSTAN